MINRILFFILTRIYKVDPKMCNPVNWRVANSQEIISKMLGYQPLICKAWQTQVQYGFENFVFLAAGQVYLCPNKIEEKYKNNVVDDISHFSLKQKLIAASEVNILPYTLFKHYMENEPNILVKKFPTRILRLMLKRHIKIQKTKILNQENEKNIPFDMSISDAIKDDLSHSSITNPDIITGQPFGTTKNRDSKR